MQGKLKIKGWKWSIHEGEVLLLQRNTPLLISFVFVVCFSIISFHIFQLSTLSELDCFGEQSQKNVHCKFQKIRPIVHLLGIKEERDFNINSASSSYFYIRKQSTLGDITNIHPKAFPNILQSFPYLIIKWTFILDPFELVHGDPMDQSDSETVIGIAYSQWYLNYFQQFISEIGKMMQKFDDLSGDQQNEQSQYQNDYKDFTTDSATLQPTQPHLKLTYNTTIIPMLWGFALALVSTSIAMNFKKTEYDINMKQQIIVKRDRSLVSANPMFLSFEYDHKTPPFKVQVVEKVRKQDGKKVFRVLLDLVEDTSLDGLKTKTEGPAQSKEHGPVQRIIVGSFLGMEDALKMKALLEMFVNEHHKHKYQNKKKKQKKKHQKKD